MYILLIITGWLLMIVLPAPAAAHPITPGHHDRTVLIQLSHERIQVEYTIELTKLTLINDLKPYAGEPDFLKQPEVLYPRIFAPKIADSITLNIDGNNLKLKPVGTLPSAEHVDEHLHYRFRFAALLSFSNPQQQHSLTFYDMFFFQEKGIYRIALQAEGKVKLIQSNVADTLKSAETIQLPITNVDEDRRRRTVTIAFQIGNKTTKTTSSHEPDEDEAGFWQALDTLSLQELLSRVVQSKLGLTFALLIAILFGAVHALQPGHGKTLVAAYLIGERGTIGHACFLGLVTTLTHTSIVIVLAILVPLLSGDDGLSATVHFGLALGCGLLIVAMSLWMLVRRIRGQADHVHLFGGHHHHHHNDHHHHQHDHDHTHDHHHSHDHHHNHEHHHDHHENHGSGQKVTWWALITLGIAGGLVPCADALALLALTWAGNQLWLGLWMILAFSLGLASVLVLVGVLVVKFKRFASSKWGEGKLIRSLPILSAIATLLLGLWMTLDALAHRQANHHIGQQQTVPRQEVDYAYR